MAKRTVLIVDDELTLLRSLRDALRRQGGEFEVLTAGRTDEAFELMALTTVDLVVTDFRMPGQDGISFIAEISHRYPNTRCILMTAHGDADTKNKSMANGAVSFLEKPFDLDTFISEVNRHLSVSGFTGRGLVGFSLLDILQLVSMSQQSVTITVHSNQGTGTLYVADGILVHAEANSQLSGLRAAYEIVSWSDGDITSSRGVAQGTERSINMPLMTFLMEAAKYQDEVKRMRPLASVRDTVQEWVEIEGVLAAAIVDSTAGGEVYGASSDDSFGRPALVTAVMTAANALVTASKDIGEAAGALDSLMVRFAHVTALIIPLVEGRFLATVFARTPAALDAARQSFEGNQTGLFMALSDFAARLDEDKENGGLGGLDLDDIDFDGLGNTGDVF